MPITRYKSIMVRAEIYDYFTEWSENREKYTREYGITSFSGFCTKLLNKMLDQWKTMNVDGGTSSLLARKTER